MIIGKQFAEKLYSTGDEMLDNLLERAFCEGYELGQQLFSDSKDEDEDEDEKKDKRKKKLKRLALGTGSALALAGGYQGYKHLERRKADKDAKEAYNNLNNIILSTSADRDMIDEAVEKYIQAQIRKAKKDMPGKLEMVGHALEHPVKSVKTLIDNIKSKKQKQYSSSIDLSPIKNNNPEENSDVKFYKNGSINFIYNGKTPLYNNFKDTLGTELHDALEKLFENCSSMPITIDVVILVRELKNKPDRKEGEQGGVKNYKNGSIHVIYEGRTTKTNLKESLEKRLLSALDKSYNYMDSRNMPIIMDVIFNVRETK